MESNEGKTQMNSICVKKEKPKSEYLSSLGSDFIAPDGGWGWIICIAAGLSNFVSFPLIQQFGFIFRNQLTTLGITITQITTLINTCSALAHFTGLFNGPIFKYFKTRTVSLAGAILLVSGIILTSVANSFLIYLVTFSIMYGIGLGICTICAVVTLNTYFQIKRRLAHAICWTITGLGYTVMPYVANSLTSRYEITETVLIFAAIATVTFISAMTYHPVSKYAKKKSSCLEEVQYDKSNQVKEYYRKTLSYQEEVVVEKKNNFNQIKDINTNSTINDKEISVSTIEPYKIDSCENDIATTDDKTKNCNKHTENISTLKSLTNFFEFDLLKDITIINLLLGLTFTQFADTNLVILYPFILADFGLTKSQIATIITTMGITDLVTTFLIPILLSKVSLQNKTLYLISIGGIGISKILLAYIRTYELLIVVGAWTGIFRGVRTVFAQLVIPSYVPVERIPIATGLQTLFLGVISLLAGPLVGLVREATNYTITLHFLNIATIWIFITWGLEDLYRKRESKNKLSIFNNLII